MKTLLLFPPYFSPTHPYLSLPCLTAYLREKGMDARQLDLNIECYNYFLSPEFLSACKQKFIAKKSGNEAEKYTLLFDYLIENITLAKKILKDPELFYDMKNYKFAKTCINHAVRLICDAYGIESLGSIISFKEKYQIKEALRLVEDTERNPFIRFYEHDLSSREDFGDYDVYGISLISDDQIVPALLLCQYIRKMNPNAHITIGGNIFSKIAYKMEGLKELFGQYLDSIILFEGEYPLYRLIQVLGDKGDLKEVPNLIYKDSATQDIIQTKTGAITNVNELPVPCFDDIDFSKYFSPRKMIPYYFSRSCYWGKCAFCDHDYGYDGKYRIKSMEKIVGDLKQLQQTYGVSFFDFVDEAIPPKILENFHDQLKQEKMEPIQWFNCVKADNNFTDEVCWKMKESGCRAIYIGVESCSEKLLKEMNKGTNLEKIYTTLSNMDRNGIWNHTFLINNFPTETKEDKYNTLMFVMKNQHLFHSIGLSEFTLGAKSKIMNNPSSFNIQEVVESGEFKSFLSFKLPGEFSIKEREQNTKELKDIYNLIPTNAFAAHTIKYREHLPIFLDRYEFRENRGMYCQQPDLKQSEGIVLSENVICREFNTNQAMVYHLEHDFMYIIPGYFLKIVEFFKDRRTEEETKEFFFQQISEKNRKKIIDFLNQISLLNCKIAV